MKKTHFFVILIFLESYAVTLLLNWSHGNPLLSIHVLLTSIFGAIIFFISGGAIAAATLLINKWMGYENFMPHILWSLTVGVFGIVLAIGADPYYFR